MSQIGNKIKAGYFKTPDLQGEHLKSLLLFTGDCSTFDPTCGEGMILKQLTEDTQDFEIRSYGVELDKRRADEATKRLHTVIQAPIESMVISHDVFSFLFLNPPYDHTMLGIGDEEKSERKEYTELVRNTKYLMPHGIMVYIIPSYRFADKRIARYLATHFEDVALAKFSAEDYDDFRQCIFIGRLKNAAHKSLNSKLFDFLLQMSSEEHIEKNVTPINIFVGKKTWEIPPGPTNIPTFYSKIERKKDFIDSIKNNKGFRSFIERTKPKQLVIGGDPIINIAQGQMALLLASGAVNGLIGEGETLHAVQGMEIVSKVVTEEKSEHSTITKSRTKRDVSIKVILPNSKVKKLV